MSGSLFWQPYNSTLIGGATFSVQIDESNARATYNGSRLFADGALSPVQKPKTLKMRGVRAYAINNPKLTRIFWVGAQELWQSIASDTAALIIAPAASDNTDATGGANITWVVTSVVSEKQTRRPRAVDTGLTDGTTTGA